MSTDWSFDPQTGELHNEPPRNISEYTVSELSFALKRTLEDAYGYVRVRGEIGRVTNPGSGHCYLDLKDDRSVDVEMTLTTPNCPAAAELPTMVENAVASVAGIGIVNVNIVWEPAWTPERMTDEARLVLNMW